MKNSLTAKVIILLSQYFCYLFTQMIHPRLPSLEMESGTSAESSKNNVYFSTTSGSYHYPCHATPYLLLANFRESGDYMLNNRKMTVSDNYFYMLNPGDRLEIDFKKKRDLETFLVAFDEEFIADALHFATRSEGELLDLPQKERLEFLAVPSVPFIMNDEIARQLHLILKSSREEEILKEILISFFQLLDDTENRLQNLSAVKRITREEIYRRLFLSEEFIRGHLSDSISLEQMAGAACLNSFHYLKLFKELFHTTPHQYLIGLRLEKAYDQLKRGHSSVTEVCYSSGFQSPASFSHLFKKTFGFSPSELVK